MDAVVLASHLAGEGHFRSKRYRVQAWTCTADDDYWRGLASVWDSDLPIINIEHDVEVTDDDLSELLACSHGACSFMYPMHWACTGRFDDVWPARNDGLFVDSGTEFAAQSAIGLIKLTPEVRIAPLKEAPWNRLEVSIEEAILRPWHLHWGDLDGTGQYGSNPPLKHHHW